MIKKYLTMKNFTFLKLFFVAFMLGFVALVDATQYKLVKNIADLAVGDKIVITDNASYAMKLYESGNNCKLLEVNITDGVFASTDATIGVITLENAIDSCLFNTASGYLYAAGGTTNNNYLKATKDTLASCYWSLAIDTLTGVATIITKDTTVVKNTMRFNSSNKLFSCYASGQKDVYIYEEVPADEEVDVAPDAPILSEEGGVFVSTDKIDLEITAEADATIKYVLNGGEVATYSEAIEITTTTTILAWAERNELKSDTVIATYTFLAEGLNYYNYVFEENSFDSVKDTVELNEVSWILSAEGTTYLGKGTSEKGIQIGKGADPAESIVLSTNGIAGKITKVIVNTSGALEVDAKLLVSVNGVAYGDSAVLTNVATEYVFEGTEAGEIVLRWENSSEKAVYVKSVYVEYAVEGGSEVDVENDEVNFSVYVEGGTIKVEAEIGAMVEVYDVIGQRIYAAKAISEVTTIGGVEGIAIIRVNGETVKLIVK